MSEARAYAQAHRDEALARLVSFLEIPSVSAVPEHAPDMRRAAAWLREVLASAGLAAEVRETGGHPLVLAKWHDAPGAPHLLVYGHYDVQPPDPVAAWDSPPFSPQVRDGALYARGASDDKGQVMTHVEAMLAFARTTGLPLNFTVLVEGEEEVGSENLDDWLRRHADELQADVAVISDTALAGPDLPSLVYGLRGLVYTEVAVRGPRRDLHSGQFGGAVLNPVHALAGMIAALHDERGRITIPGFYDAVRVLDETERSELAATPFDAAAHDAATGAAGSWGEGGYSIAERTGARPSLDVNGIWAGWTGDGAKTVIPASAHAKISLRLVPHQTPEDAYRQFAAHLAALAPDGVDVEVTLLNQGEPCLVQRDHPAVAAAIRAYRTGFGREPVFKLEGGSIPVVASLQHILGIDSVLLGFGLPDDNLHAPNEHFALANFERGVDTVIAFYEALAQAS